MIPGYEVFLLLKCIVKKVYFYIVTVDLTINRCTHLVELDASKYSISVLSISTINKLIIFIYYFVR